MLVIVVDGEMVFDDVDWLFVELMVWLFGFEVYGLLVEIVVLVDYCVYILMLGGVESFNVVVVVVICLYESVWVLGCC